MGKKKSKKGSSGGNKKNNRSTSSSSSNCQSGSNFVSEAGPGCYIARRRHREDSKQQQAAAASTTRTTPSWLIEWEDVDPRDFFGHEEVPDVAIDTDEHTLSICNIDNSFKVAYVTIYDVGDENLKVVGADGTPLIPGTTTDNHGVTKSCLTFIVLVPPCVFVHLCYLELPPGMDVDITALRIESDISPWRQHPKPNDEHGLRIGFPLGQLPAAAAGSCNPSASTETHLPPSFLCTQGEGGELTHFFSGNLHAIDFQCPIGTEVLAVADGVVVDAKDDNTTLTGIAVTNLYEWNSILLQICRCKNKSNDNTNDDTVPKPADDGPLFVEYVHIQTSLVQKGDVVQKGQVIGYSGSVGFSPEPHLHFSAFRSSEPTAPTVRVLFDGGVSSSTTSTDGSDKANSGRPFLPVAGQRYNAHGAVR